MSWLSDLLGSATSGLIPSEITDIYETALPQISAPDISFQPFSVRTTGLGGVRTLEDGSVSYNLSEGQKALQNQLFGGASVTRKARCHYQPVWRYTRTASDG